MMPYLAVVTPVYATPENKRLELFVQTAQSLLAQNIDFRWVIVDDSSPDARLKDYLATLKDGRIKAITRQRKPGDIKTASNALNTGFDFALNNTNCEAFCYFHSDDIAPQNSLAARVDALNGDSMLYGKKAMYSKGKIHCPRTNFTNPLNLQNLMSGFPHHTSTWSRRFLEEMVGRRDGELFDPNISYGEDLDVTYCARRILEEGHHRMVYLDDFVYIWIDNPFNISTDTMTRDRREQVRRVQKKNGYPGDGFNVSDLVLRFIRTPGFFLPEMIKKHVRPHKQEISRLSFGLFFPQEHYACDKLDPHWFKKFQKA
jgi:glycosyltransferase involved in cell wall biosynthesis